MTTKDGYEILCNSYNRYDTGGGGNGGYTSADEQPYKVIEKVDQFFGGKFKCSHLLNQSYDDAFVRLPPISGGAALAGGGGYHNGDDGGGGGGGGGGDRRNPYYHSCAHPQSKICQNLRYD